ncbi:hypothetical protein FSP39_014839 [Pinctada imbricata]|uniref:Uncharacterized protein n=1 Tax=Pinctada imbricata TaxID=66713 RepID=A0AA88YMS9_PINIB|nr:hypothetical protein FSP39_014839 [Pinctada imbricata]
MDDEEGRSSLISHLYKESSKRQQRIIQRIKVENYVLQELLHLPLFVAGSRADGSNDSFSDIDLNYLVQNFLVMRDGDKIIASTDKDILILRQGNCYPGYCKLEFSSGTPSDVQRILTYQAHTNKKNVADGLLSNSDFLAKARELVPVLFKNFGGSLRNLKNIHGPCVTPTHTIGKDEGTEMDLAFCIQCDHWPDMANEWLDRYRPNGWPGFDLIQRIRNYKCWFVPIGFSEEEEKRDVEWRVSFTIAERDLMWSLQPTQLLCVEFLKSFVSHKLEHKFPNLLCSYFLKTIMFWLFEESPVSFWQSQNLIECMKGSINKLIQSLASRECPHYFIRNNNLFVKKHGDSLSEAGTSHHVDGHRYRNKRFHR